MSGMSESIARAIMYEIGIDDNESLSFEDFKTLVKERDLQQIR